MNTLKKLSVACFFLTFGCASSSPWGSFDPVAGDYDQRTLDNFSKERLLFRNKQVDLFISPEFLFAFGKALADMEAHQGTGESCDMNEYLVGFSESANSYLISFYPRIKRLERPLPGILLGQGFKDDKIYYYWTDCEGFLYQVDKDTFIVKDVDVLIR